MSQDFPLLLTDWRSLALSALALILPTGVISVILTKWLERRKYKAEVRQTDVETIVAAGDALGRNMERLTQAQDRYDKLRLELTDLQDQCADLINNDRERSRELTEARFEIEQLKTDIELKDLFIGRLHAATKLGVQLKELPASLDDVILMLEVLRKTTPSIEC